MFSRQRCRKCRRGAASRLVSSPFPLTLLMPPMLLTLIALLLMLLLTFLALSLTKKPLQKSRDPHNDKVDFVIVRVSRFLEVFPVDEAMHAHGTSSVSHPGSFLKTVRA